MIKEVDRAAHKEVGTQPANQQYKYDNDREAETRNISYRRAQNAIHFFKQPIQYIGSNADGCKNNDALYKIAE